MRDAFPVKLLKLVLDSALEQQAAIDRFLGGQDFPDRESKLPR
jgi:hypothetical protein